MFPLHLLLSPLLCLHLSPSHAQGQGDGIGGPSLKLLDNINPRNERATLFHLGDAVGKEDNSSSYSYLLSLGKGEMLSTVFQRGANKIPKGPEKQSLMSGQGLGNMQSVVDSVGSVVQNMAGDMASDTEKANYGYTSLLSTRNDSINFPQSYVPPASFIVTSGDSADFMESRTLAPEPRIPPPRPTKTYNLQRTSPHDVVGFSAVRASGFSRMGDSRIFFENTITDANYGWDSRNSIFITHFPGLYFFTFSVKADADKGDNFKYEVSLMKNGEEVVSVGGAIDPSNKNVGTSASTSIILDLKKEDRVWLQLLRGNLVETTNRKTGYSSFSGYRLGCGVFKDKPSDFSEVALEDIAVSLDNESLQTLDESAENNVDRYGVSVSYKDKRPDYYDDPEKNYNEVSRPHIYSDDKLYDAFEYEKDQSRGSLRPAHRPFAGNGPAIVEEENIHNNHQAGYDDFFSLKDKQSSSHNRYSENRDENSGNRDRYSENRDRFTADKDRYSSNKDRITSDRDRVNGDRDRYSSKKDRVTSDRVSGDRNRNPSDRDRPIGDRYSNDRTKYSTDRYNTNIDRLSEDRDKNTGDRFNEDKESQRYPDDRDRYSDDRYNSVRTKPETKYSDDRYEYKTRYKTPLPSSEDIYEYKTPLPSSADRFSVGGDRFGDQDTIREGTMFFHKRQSVEPPVASESDRHISYGK